MDVAFIVAPALALGFLVGLGVGALRAFRIAARQRDAEGAAARFARFFPGELPTRSAVDILAGRIRLGLGGQVFDLPVLPRGASRRWLESIDLAWAALGTEIEALSDNTPEILARLMAQQTAMVGMLRSYDQSGILPDEAWFDEYPTDIEVFRAVVEVWRAANPLAATLVEASYPTNGSSPESPSTPPLPTAGDPLTSMST